MCTEPSKPFSPQNLGGYMNADRSVKHIHEYLETTLIQQCSDLVAALLVGNITIARQCATNTLQQQLLY